MASVQLQNASKRYVDDRGQEVQALSGLDLEVRDGEFLVLVGPSGCGKSTALRLIAGLEELSGGSVAIDGVDVSQRHPKDREVALVFQSYALYPHMTVAENMSFGLKLRGAGQDEIQREVTQAAQVLRLSECLDRLPKELSGGQRQRVAVGRALLRKPKVFLFDEPLSNLDARLRVELRIELVRLHQELKTTAIYVTHDQVEAMSMGDRIAVFSAGRLQQVADPRTLYEKPANAFVAGFIGSPPMNLLPGDALAGGSSAQRVGVRAEDLTLDVGEDAPALSGEVALVEYLGNESILHVDVAGERVLARVQGEAPQRGETVRLGYDPERLHRFDAASGERIEP